MSTCRYPRALRSSHTKSSSRLRISVPFGVQRGRPEPTRSENTKRSSSGPSFLWSRFFAPAPPIGARDLVELECVGVYLRSIFHVTSLAQIKENIARLVDREFFG